MPEDSKFNRDRLFRTFVSYVMKNQGEGEDDDGRDDRIDFRTARDLISAIASWAGKGKDEIIQVLCREIGVATAAVLKEPLTQVVENQKLVITVEFAPKSGKTERPEKKESERATQKRAR